MSNTTQATSGMYIYAFMSASDLPVTIPSELVGIDGATIQMESSAGLAVAMSPTESRKIRPQRKNLAAHQEVVTWLAQHHDMLPVAFGLIADDTEQIHRLMTSHRSVLLEQIERVAGQVEMTVSLSWNVPNVVQYFVERHAELAAIRTVIASGSATRDEQIAAGQLLESLINAERQMHTERFTGVLHSVCKEIDVLPPKVETDIMRLACLIARDAEQKFTQALYQAASLFSDEFTVSFNGPWPPYSFVNLTLSLE